MTKTKTVAGKLEIFAIIHKQDNRGEDKNRTMSKMVNERGTLLMSTDYAAVLRRLKEERIEHGLSQEELGSLLRMSQGHYSKAEHAVKRFTYYEVKSLVCTDLDLYYIYTGRRMSGKYNRLFECCSYRELLCYLNMTASLLACMYEEQKLDLGQEFYRQLSCVRYITGGENRHRETVFTLIRQLEKKTQCGISEQLGMDVKKYRELERGGILPDSELIWKLYKLYRVPPALVLEDAKGIVSQIEYFLERSQSGRNDLIFRYSRLLHDYYKSKQ